MSETTDQLKEQVRKLAESWAKEYSGVLTGAAEEVSRFFQATAALAAQNAIEGDEEALRLLRLAGYSMVTHYKLELKQAHRATVQRGIRLLIDAVSVVVAAATGSITSAVGKIVSKGVEEIGGGQ